MTGRDLQYIMSWSGLTCVKEGLATGQDPAGADERLSHTYPDLCKGGAGQDPARADERLPHTGHLLQALGHHLNIRKLHKDQCWGSGLDPNLEALWIRIRILNTDPDPHMLIT